MRVVLDPGADGVRCFDHRTDKKKNVDRRLRGVNEANDCLINYQAVQIKVHSAPPVTNVIILRQPQWLI